MILYSQKQFDETAGSRLLRRALEEKQQSNLERIFRLLGLVYPPNDIFYAYQGFISGKKALQANAIEFLDNLLSRDVKKYILPILDDVPVETVLRKGEEFFQVRMSTKEDALERLITGRDNWIKCCAIYNVSPGATKRLKDLVYEAGKDPDPLVCETAEHVISGFEE
jgi:AAA family ATP:ADP antiporter